MPMTAWINRPGVLAFLGVEGIWWLAALGALVVIVCGLLLLQQRQKVRRSRARRGRGETGAPPRPVWFAGGGCPPATTPPPAGTAWLPKVLHCRNCSMVGASVSETQLISSMKRMPS